jgi:hypothetical protein
MILLPIFFYFIFFCVLTYPLITSFFTHLFADQGDGLQNLWNLWWVNKAVTQLHQSPWHTSYLRYPSDMSLLGHTLNPFNGFMGIVLLKFLTPHSTYNFIVVFSFVVGGFTAFLLAYYFTRSYWGSIIAGYIFTFSNYHFAHAQGHLNLESLEWIPLFLLCWYRLMTKPGVAIGITSALVLFLIILCDYYYFFYSVLAGCLIFVWSILNKKDIFFFLRRNFSASLGAFLVTVLITTGPLIMLLLLLDRKDPWIGAHQPEEYSLDLLALFIPGGHWRFSQLTQFYWSRLPGNIDESSTHMGISTLCFLILVWIKRSQISIQGLWLWYFILIFFMILSLGPVLHIGGREISFIQLPYRWLEEIFPPVKLSGAPVRMMVMVMLSTAVICAAGFKVLFQESQGTRWLAGLLIILLFIEYLPKSIPSSKLVVPEHIKVLKNLSDSKGVIDAAARPTLALYYQTIHEKPIAFGYASRIPTSIRTKDQKLAQTLNDGQYQVLYCDYNIRFLIVDAARDISFSQLLYQDSEVRLYDLERTC